jgi:hypothetical protein
MPLLIRSPAFEPGGEIPRAYTCQGENVSPELVFSGIPEGSRSLALVADDPDAPDPAAPQRTFVHWVLYDLPPDAVGLPRAVSDARLPPGTRQGRNDRGATGYVGPCPPIGRHRYFFKLYALDAGIGDRGSLTKAEILAAMEGHVLAAAEVIGTYQKGG